MFREQPTSELAQSARAGLRSAISPNERYQQLFHPFTSYVIVPLFALANAGIAINGAFLAHAYGSPITLGIIVAYLVGKPIGISGAAGLVTRLSRGRIRPPVGWGVGDRRRRDRRDRFHRFAPDRHARLPRSELAEAKLGVLTTLIGAPLVSWIVLRATKKLPRERRLRAIVGQLGADRRPGGPRRPRARPHPRSRRCGR